jgi:hypothetical protein
MQVSPNSSVDSRYLLSKGRAQDAPIFRTLFDVAGQPDTIEIDYDDTKQVNRANIDSILAIYRQKIQRFLSPFII